MNKEQRGYGLCYASSNPKYKYTLNAIKVNFDNLFIKHNWKHLGLHIYNMGSFKSQYKK